MYEHMAGGGMYERMADAMYEDMIGTDTATATAAGWLITAGGTASALGPCVVRGRNAGIRGNAKPEY